MRNELIKLLYFKGLPKEALCKYIKDLNYWAFKFSCENGQLEIVKFLLEQGFAEEQIKAEDYWAFRLACYKGHLEVAKLLLEQGFVKEQIKALRRFENSFFKIKYKDLVEKGIVNE